jgi:hypothetical protein
VFEIDCVIIAIVTNIVVTEPGCPVPLCVCKSDYSTLYEPRDRPRLYTTTSASMTHSRRSLYLYVENSCLRTLESLQKAEVVVYNLGLSRGSYNVL